MALSSGRRRSHDQGRAQLERVRGNRSALLNSPGFAGTRSPGSELGSECHSVCVRLPHPAGCGARARPQPDPRQRWL